MKNQLLAGDVRLPQGIAKDQMSAHQREGKIVEISLKCIKSRLKAESIK
jgi:hypothetical protein